jgi:hypothetical protein
MFDWLRRRRLSNEAKRKLLIAAARAEEAIVETHVANILELLEILRDEVDVDRALELYMEMLPMDEHIAPTVTNRVLARHDSPGVRPPTTGRYGGVFRETR